MARKVIRPSADDDLLIEDEGVVITGPVTGKSYTFKMVTIPSKDIKACSKVSEYNGRSTRHLSLASVSDIYPEIKRDKRNQHPIKAYGSKHAFNVIEGTRRTHAVSLLDDGTLYMLLTPNMDEDDVKALSQSSDKYSKPTTFDLAFKIKELNLDEQSIRSIAAELDCSKGTADNAKKILTLGESIFDLFPALKFIDLRFVLNLVNIRNEDPTQFDNCISQLDDFKQFLTESELKQYDDNDVLDESVYVKASSAMKSLILAKVTAPKTAPALPKEYESIKQQDGVKAKMNNKGQLVLTIDESVLSNKGSDLVKLLSS